MRTAAETRDAPPRHAGMTRTEWRWALIGAAVAVGAFWLLATWGRPWELFARGPFSSDFYDVQARALAHGRLDVPPQVAGIEGFVVGGRTYLYFGIGPALWRLPFVAFTHSLDGRLALVSQLAAVAVLSVSSARLLARARTLVRDAPSGSPWWFALGAAVPVVCSPVLFLASRPVVYHEAELWGAAAALAGLDLVLRWWEAPSLGRLVAAVAMATFAMACRPSSGAAPAVALGLFAVVVATRRRWAEAGRLVAAAVVPLLGFSAVNYARFGSLYDVPFPKQVFSTFNQARQAALAANNGSLFGLKFAPTTVVQYLSPLTVVPQRLFPFLTWGPRAHVIGSVTFDTVDHSSSLTTGAPLLVVLALVGLWWTIRRDHGWSWRVVALAAAIPTVSTFTIAYVAQRYLADLVPPLVVLAAPAVWVLARHASRWARWAQVALVSALVLLGGFATWSQTALAIEARAFSIVPSHSELLGLARFQYRLDDHLFGGKPPHVRALTGPDLPTAEDGDLVILDDCAGLYRYDGYSWGTLERTAGAGRRLVLRGDPATLVAPDGSPSVLARGDGWRLEVARADGGLVVTYRPDRGEPVASSPVAWDGGSVTFDVVADPATQEISVTTGGHQVVAAVYVPASGLTAGPGWAPQPAAAPFCQSLLARLGGG